MVNRNQFESYEQSVWDKVFEFITPSVGEVSRQEVQTELKRAGIDMRDAIHRVRLSLEAVSARDSLAKARERRPDLITRVISITQEQVNNVREFVHNLIEKNVSNELKPVYFRKLESAATDQDLNSLLEDIRRLDAMDEDKADGHE